MGALDPSYLLTESAFRYYLPAYLSAAIRIFEEMGEAEILLEPTYALAPGRSNMSRVIEYRQTFTFAQVLAVRAYLLLCSEHQNSVRGLDLQRALDMVWI